MKSLSINFLTQRTQRLYEESAEIEINKNIFATSAFPDDNRYFAASAVIFAVVEGII
jgi:hypothetical protein